MENKEKIFKESIAPVMDKMLAVCNDNGIPFFMAFGVKEDSDGKLDLRSQGLIPEEFHYKVNDRRFSDFVNVVNGFKTVPEEVKKTMDMDDEEWGGLPTGYGIE